MRPGEGMRYHFEKQEDLEDVCKACVDQENAEAEVTNAWAWRAWL